MTGFFAIGISHTKTEANVGVLWRAAHIFGAAFCFTIGRRFKQHGADTTKTWRSTPMFHFSSLADLKEHIPHDSLLVGVELDVRAEPIEDFVHPPRAVYLLGAEDHGLMPEEIAACHRLVRLPGERSMNVAMAGTVCMYARHEAKRARKLSFAKAAE